MKRTGKHTKSLDCRYCGEEVQNVGDDAVKVTCSSCVNKALATNITPIDDEDLEDESNEFSRND